MENRDKILFRSYQAKLSRVVKLKQAINFKEIFLGQGNILPIYGVYLKKLAATIASTFLNGFKAILRVALFSRDQFLANQN